jgi:hypothetical protein
MRRALITRFWIIRDSQKEQRELEGGFKVLVSSEEKRAW